MGKKRAYSAKPSITSGDRCRASLPGLALLLGMGAASHRPHARSLRPLGAESPRTPQKPSSQIPCQQFSREEFHQAAIGVPNFVMLTSCTPKNLSNSCFSKVSSHLEAALPVRSWSDVVPPRRGISVPPNGSFFHLQYI
jgi:hypothetical protein